VSCQPVRAVTFSSLHSKSRRDCFRPFHFPLAVFLLCPGTLRHVPSVAQSTAPTQCLGTRWLARTRSVAATLATPPSGASVRKCPSTTSVRTRYEFVPIPLLTPPPPPTQTHVHQSTAPPSGHLKWPARAPNIAHGRSSGHPWSSWAIIPLVALGRPCSSLVLSGIGHLRSSGNRPSRSCLFTDIYNTNTNTVRGVRQRTRSSTRGRRVLQPLPWLASTTLTHAWRSHAQLDKLQTTRCTHAGAF
jgi:hypothetical protein